LKFLDTFSNSIYDYFFFLSDSIRTTQPATIIITPHTKEACVIGPLKPF